jgi:uncharacterized protein involved in outer membrane biogenesis
MEGGMRKIGVILGIVFALLVVAMAAVWVLANPNRHRDLIQTQLENQLGRKVTLGEMSLGLLPLRFQVKDPVIAEDPGLNQPQPFIRAEQLSVMVDLFPLLSGNVRVKSIELRRPAVQLIRSKQGVWNFATLGSKSAAASTTATQPSPGKTVSLDNLAITDGQVDITDQQRGSKSEYNHIDLTLTGYAPDKPFSFDLAAHIQGDGAQEVRLKGEAGPVASNDPADTPFHGTLQLNQVGIEGLMKFLDTQVITQAQGVLSGESNIGSQGGSITTSGKIKIDKAQVNKLDIGYPIAFDYNLTAKTNEGLINIENATLQLGQTPLSVAGSVRTATTPVAMNLKIKSADVSIAEIARLASAFGVVFPRGTTVGGRVNTDLQLTGSSAKPAITGKIGGRNLKISGEGIPQPVEVKAINLALSPSAIQSDQFNATSGKSTIVGQFALHQYTSNSPSVDLRLRAPEATLPEIQAIAKAYGVTALDQISGGGALNFDLNASGPVQALSTDAAIKALNGVINLDFSPLKIAGFDTLHELGKLGGFAQGQTDQNSTEMVKIAGKILVKNGVAQTDGLNAQLLGANLLAAGTSDLSAQTLNLRVSTVFSKAFSDKVAGSRAGGLLNAALTNNSGEIVIPALVTGNIKKPVFSPDLKAVAQLQKQKFLPSLDNPGGAIGNILGVLKGKQDTGNQDNTKQDTSKQEQPTPASTIKGLLDAFGKKKP